MNSYYHASQAPYLISTDTALLNLTVTVVEKDWQNG